jgi:hypothetical protein
VSSTELVVRVTVVALLVLVGVVTVLYGTSARNRWGVNFQSRHCPHCNTPAPRIRLPKSLHQFMWGGWTCRACGIEVDKWGREVGRRSPGTGGA